MGIFTFTSVLAARMLDCPHAPGLWGSGYITPGRPQHSHSHLVAHQDQILDPFSLAELNAPTFSTRASCDEVRTHVQLIFPGLGSATKDAAR